MTGAYCKTILFEIWSHKKNGPYICYAFSLRCFIPLFSYCMRSRKVGNGFRRVVRLFLTENAVGMEVACVSV